MYADYPTSSLLVSASAGKMAGEEDSTTGQPITISEERDPGPTNEYEKALNTEKSVRQGDKPVKEKEKE